MLFLGGIIGGLIPGYIAQKIGRKITFGMSAFLYVVGLTVSMDVAYCKSKMIHFSYDTRSRNDTKSQSKKRHIPSDGLPVKGSKKMVKILYPCLSTKLEQVKDDQTAQHLMTKFKV